MRILVDVDDVVADLLPTWLARYNVDYRDNVKKTDITAWDMVRFVKRECGYAIYDYLKAADLYEQVVPVFDAAYGVRTLRNMGHEIIFVTSVDHPDKLPWLIRNKFLSEENAEKHYIATKKKFLVGGDALIDDNTDFLADFLGHKILFNQPHNQYTHVPGAARVSSWVEVVGYFETISQVGTTGTTLRTSTSGGITVTTGIPGVGKDVPTAVNENGGKQSRLDYRFDLVDPKTMFVLANILHEGANKYGLWNWRRITLEDNLNHALSHIYAYLAQDTTDDHLGHAFCRLMFALSLHLTPGDAPWMKPE